MGSSSQRMAQSHWTADIIKISLFLILMTASTLAPAANTWAVCREEGDTLKALKQEVTDLSARQEKIDKLADGTLSADVDIHELLGAPLGNDVAVAKALDANKSAEGENRNSPNEAGYSEGELNGWPAALTCKTLRDEYQEALNDYVWLQRTIRKRQITWLSMPKELRIMLKTLWMSRQKQEAEYEKLAAAIKDANLDIDLTSTPLGAVHAQQQILRLKILRLLPKLNKNINAEDIGSFLNLWQYAIETKMVVGEFASEDIDAFPSNVKSVGREYIAMARQDSLQMRYLINHIRGWLWRNAHSTFLVAVSNNGGMKSLLVYEFHAIQFRLTEIQSDITLELATRAESERPTIALLSIAMSYLFGIAAMVLLGYIAKRLSLPVLALNDHLSSRVKGRRSLTNLSRLLGGIAPLVPWTAGWFGLSLLSAAYSHYNLPLLVGLIPFARLYIVYGLVALIGEWLLLRIAQQASVYLSNDQADQMNPYAKRTARIIVLPWLLMDVVATGIGPSLTLRICALFSLVTFITAISMLLNSRRNDLLLAMQSLLPPKLDPIAEKILKGRLAYIFAPLCIPPLLISFMTAFIHKVMIDFDWYRKLSARWFKIRAQVADANDNENEGDEGIIADDYGCWFVDESDEKELPYIDSGLLTAVRKHLNRWLDENTEENSLLLTGERGIGKSSALSKLKASLAEDHPELHITHLCVPAKTKEPSDVQKFIGEALHTDLTDGPSALVHSDAAREPTLIILDNAQNFFLSNVGGMEGWQTLLSLTNARLENIYWLIVINNQSWAYMSNVFGRDYQFRNVLRAKPWSQNDIRSLILSRNHLSGYKIKYDEVLLASRGPDAGNIRNAEQRYFSLLWDACRGNPMLALRLWMTSVHTEGKEVVVGMPEEPSSAAVEKIGSNLLFVYAAVVMHENLSSDEIVAATSLPGSVVRYALKTAFDAGFLQRSKDGRYRLVPLWYHTITTLLARKNLLHE